MFKNKFPFFVIILTSILIQEVLCGCSPVEFSIFEKCFVEYSRTEFASKPFTKWADVEKTCKDFRRSQLCMSLSNINHCANTKGFTKFTQSQEEGANMAANYWHLNFICGRGYEAGKNVFPCLLTKMRNCYISNCTCDVLQETINVCSNNIKEHCGQDAYDYVYGTLATGRCHINPECNFLQDVCKYCGEISDYANAPSEIEKLHNDAILHQQLYHPETALIAQIISAETISSEELIQFLPKVVKVLQKPSKEQFISVWILRSLSRLSLDFIYLIMDENGIPHLIKLLELSDLDLQEQAILAVGNIIDSDSDLRDYCIQHEIIERMKEIIFSPHSQIRVIRHSAWVIKNIIGRDGMVLSNDEMDKIIPALSKFLTYEDDIFILADTFFGIWEFAQNNSTNIQYLIDHGIVKSVIKHLSNKNPKIQSSALRTFAEFLGDKNQIQYLIDNGVLQSMNDLLKINNKHALYFLNSIIANHHEFIQRFFDAQLIPSIVNGLISEILEVQINSLFGIHSIVEHGTYNHTVKLIHMDVVSNLCKFLNQLDIKNIKENKMILFTIKKILAKDTTYHHKIVEQIKASGGLNVFERLQNHEDKKIRMFATSSFQRIQEYFSLEEEVEEYIFHDEF